MSSPFALCSSVAHCSIFSLSTTLEHTDESSIKLVWRVIPYKGRYYIMNGYTDSNVLVFDKQGKFVYKIDKRGQGPGEYISLNDIAIDPKWCF